MKISVPMSNSMVVCRYLQSWLTVAMKCRVMYSYRRQPSLPAEPQQTRKWGQGIQGRSPVIKARKLVCKVTWPYYKTESQWVGFVVKWSQKLTQNDLEWIVLKYKIFYFTTVWASTVLKSSLHSPVIIVILCCVISITLCCNYTYIVLWL